MIRKPAIQTAPVHTPDTPATEYTLGFPFPFPGGGCEGHGCQDHAGAAYSVGTLPAEIRYRGSFGTETLSCASGMVKPHRCCEERRHFRMGATADNGCVDWVSGKYSVDAKINSDGSFASLGNEALPYNIP